MGVLKADNTLHWECYFPILFPQQNKSRYAPAYCCTLWFFLFTFDSGKKSHHKRCIYNCYLVVVKKESTLRSTSPFLIFVKDEGNINQAIWQELPTLYSARKRKLCMWLEAVAKLWQAAVSVQNSKHQHSSLLLTDLILCIIHGTHYNPGEWQKMESAHLWDDQDAGRQNDFLLGEAR